MTRTSEHPPRRGPRRRSWQRFLGARYDGLFAAFVWFAYPIACASAVSVTPSLTMWLAWTLHDVAYLGVVALLAGFLLAGVVLTYLFVAMLTPVRRAFVTGAVASGGMVALLVGDVILFPTGDRLVDVLPWVAFITFLCAAPQVVALARVAPDRLRSGYGHVIVPAACATVLVVPMSVWPIMNDAVTVRAEEQVVSVATGIYAAMSFGFVALGLARVAIRSGERAVIEDFARRHGFTATADMLDHDSSWSWTSGSWSGSYGGRRAVVTAGFMTGPVDVPSIYVTELTFAIISPGPEFWVRRRRASFDNYLVAAAPMQFRSFESIEFDDRFHVHVDAAAGELAAWRTFDPQALVALLDMGDAQLFRTGNVLRAVLVGGALDADEIDRVARGAIAFIEAVETTVTSDAEHARHRDRANEVSGR